MHPWHDVELGKNSPETVTAIIEIPKGSNLKYKVDPKTGLLKLGEFLPSVIQYPGNYGFFPQTVAGDGDALDVFVLARGAVAPLTMMQVRPLGGMTVHSKKKGIEHKLIAVCEGDPEFEPFHSIKELPKFYLEQLDHFFGMYKALDGEPKTVKKVFGKKEAQKLIREAAEDYARQKNKGKLETR